MARVELFHFRYRDPRTAKWTRARYVAERQEIAERHPEGWENLYYSRLRQVSPAPAAFIDAIRLPDKPRKGR